MRPVDLLCGLLSRGAVLGRDFADFLFARNAEPISDPRRQRHATGRGTTEWVTWLARSADAHTVVTLADRNRLMGGPDGPTPKFSSGPRISPTFTNQMVVKLFRCISADYLPAAKVYPGDAGDRLV